VRAVTCATNIGWVVNPRVAVRPVKRESTDVKELDPVPIPEPAFSVLNCVFHDDIQRVFVCKVNKRC
jgi:hypothetical protein